MALSVLTQVRRTAQQGTNARTELQALLTDLRAAESNGRGYVIAGSDNYLSAYHDAVAVVQNDLSDLDSQTQGTPFARQINDLVPIIHARV
ncbi:MAG TPA: CHASE3 domain-containing protein, partial [Candidatus Saccharimonadia bacterium]|nr:CHASE3 domain-containing protein [Candidatus Saccharimonadia bacterium]